MAFSRSSSHPSISDKTVDYAKEIEKTMKEQKIRVELDTSSQTLGAKIRTHTLQRVPFLCIIGDKEIEKAASDGKKYISVRTREGKDLGMLEVAALLNTVQKTIEKRIS